MNGARQNQPNPPCARAHSEAKARAIEPSASLRKPTCTAPTMALLSGQQESKGTDGYHCTVGGMVGVCSVLKQ